MAEYNDRVVITGIGIYTPYGTNLEEFSTYFFDQNSKHLALDSPLRVIENINSENYINSFKVGKLSKATILSIIAAKQAISDSKLDYFKDSGIIIGSTYSTIDLAIGFMDNVILSQGEKLKSNIFSNTVSCAPSGEVSAELGLTGPSFMISKGADASLEALHLGYDILTTENLSAILIGGVDIFFEARKLYDRDLLQKKHKKVINEGAAVIVLEKLENAKKRKATIYAEIKLERNTDIGGNMLISNRNHKKGDLLVENYEGATGIIGVILACLIIKKGILPLNLKQTNNRVNAFNQIQVNIFENKHEFSTVIIEKYKEECNNGQYE